MESGLLGVLGGIGLFLIGMKLMTEALREAAGARLRKVLTRFTTTPLRGLLTGFGVTAVIQSSTAVTVMAVGFVGAGVLTFPQSLGLLYGANIGTTMTGWIVAFLGLKLQIGTLAQPVLFGAALVLLLGRGRAVPAAQGLAGVAMLFLGLDLMAGAASLAEDWLPTGALAADGAGTRLLGVALGLALVTIVQSSTAGMAMTLVLVGEGVLGFPLAAAVVIGLNIGTTMTALLASLGGGQAMRQTAVANTLFNLVTGLIALPMLGWIAPILHHTGLGLDDVTALVLFHTGFNLVGALLFLPFTRHFAALVARLIPDESATPEGLLDPTLLAEPEAALTAAESCADAIQGDLFRALAAALRADADLRPLSAAPQRLARRLDALEAYVARLTDGGPALRGRRAALLHRMDHLQRLGARLERRSPLAVIAADPRLSRVAHLLAERLAEPRPDARRMQRLSGALGRRTPVYRQQVLNQPLSGQGVQDLFDRTDAMRWLDHIAEHAAAILRHAAPH